MKISSTVLIKFALVFSSLTAIAETPTSGVPTNSDAAKRTLEQEITDTSAQFATKISGQVPDSIVNLGYGAYFPNNVLLVDKAQRTLTVWQQTAQGLKPIRHYPTDIGKNHGDKKSLGDHKTPEGIYTFLEKYEGSGLDFSLYGSRAFTINYPNFFDTLVGKTGSGIWLHAVPDTVPLTRGSRGCVVVRNEIIKELTQFINLKKTPIIIRDSVNYVSLEAQKKRFQQITTMLEEWRKAWETKDLEKYITFYSENFSSLKMNKRKWYRYKRDLNAKYKEIKVRFSEPSVLEQKDQIIVRSLQSYESDQHTDFGEKSLYLVFEAGTPRIVGEEWQENTDPSITQALNGSTFGPFGAISTATSASSM